MADLNLKTHLAAFKNPLYLESGRILEPFEIAYETYGELNEAKDNAIVICHALSGSHHAAGFYEGEKRPGWWDALIGGGKAVDTDKFFVICANTIGSCFGSTGPTSAAYPKLEPYRLKFPVITIKDMVKAQRLLLDSLGITRLHAVIGGSMGGMQALHYAIDYPSLAKRVIALATTSATSAWAIAFNKIAIESIVSDPEFQGGDYDISAVKSRGLRGAAIGRMAAHISFLSPESMREKFGRDYAPTDGLFDLFGKFQIERYLDYNGGNFPKWFDPLAFIYIAKAINIYDLSRGYDTLENALARARSHIYLFGFERDLLFLPAEMEAIDLAMKSVGKGDLSNYCLVKSDYGHDAFLTEVDKFSDRIAEILGAEI
ncbi:MAG: homoserine O-acetyltransferase [Helicobacteraceae bacterium]|jgi:homoserine O-acetyltransferase|nr:homoserine O-acetyltransferase [Helicobacteraceae bacterium]